MEAEILNELNRENGKVPKRFLLPVFELLLIISGLLFARDAVADLFVYDMVARKGEKVVITVESRGRLFAKGGVVIELSADGRSLGKALSGGDGFAYKEFVPGKTGVYRLAAKSGEEEGRGLLLSIDKGKRVVLVDFEGSMLESPFSRKLRDGSKKVLSEINRRYPVIFLQTGLLGLKHIKAFLQENGMTDFPVLSWNEGSLFDEFSEKGYRIKAVVGSPGVIESAKRHRPLLFSFGEAKGAERVGEWKEIGKKLK
jgi:hypothetical protein